MTITTLKLVCYQKYWKDTFHHVHSPARVHVLQSEGLKECTALENIRGEIDCDVQPGHVRSYSLPPTSPES